MIKPLVEFCISNLASGAQEAYEQLDRDPNVDVIEYGCLNYCGICGDSMYALVNGDIVRGHTASELLENIYEYLEENPMF
ncbi:MAG: YuzB family protein [Bacillus sp. (in: firmicutes)]